MSRTPYLTGFRSDQMKVKWPGPACFRMRGKNN
jgi:hypothetical protein